MATVSSPVRNAPAPFASSRSDQALALIQGAGVGIALWERDASEELACMLGELDLRTVDDVEIQIDLPLSLSTLTANLVVSGYGSELARLLAADILALAGKFAVISGSTRLDVRLEVVETDACWRFHADYVTFRLLTTYHGQGTQWIRTEAPEDIQQMAAGEVAILKGRILQEEPVVLHRSPPVSTTGESRLLLVMNPVIDHAARTIMPEMAEA